MDARERMLTAIHNEKPDHLPVQVHNWMPYYLNRYLDGMDCYQAYERFGMDMAIYTGPNWIYDPKDLDNWRVEIVEVSNANGVHNWLEIVHTPKGDLRTAFGSNEITTWETEPLIKTADDFDLYDAYYPVPIGVDGTQVRDALNRVGNRGIVRGIIWCHGQMGCWQSFCTLVGTQEAILFAMDDPDWVHHAESRLLDKQMRALSLWTHDEVPFDLIELGGGGGSNTVISPALHAQFCVPYDRKQVDTLHELGYKVVYHLCGGLMKQLDNVLDNGADGLETMTPPAMGGDCDLAEANRRVGDRLFFVGGFDQNAGFEKGTPAAVRQQVLALHAARPQGGYICCPSDHFFYGNPENIQAFVDAARECVYD